MGEFCPMLNATSTALTGAINGSEITQARRYTELLSGSTKIGKSIRASIDIVTSPRNTDTVFARM